MTKSLVMISLFPWRHSGEQQKTSASAEDQIVLLSIYLYRPKNLTICASPRQYEYQFDFLVSYFLI